MSNTQTVDLTDKYVILAKEFFKPEFRDITWRVFHAEGGFGCSPFNIGSAVFGTCVRDGERFRTERHFVERLATESEVTAAQNAGGR